MHSTRCAFGLFTLALIVSLGCPCSSEAADDSPAERVTALADRYANAYKERFPTHYEYSGLPTSERDSLPINSPADLAAWWSLVATMQADADAIDMQSIAGTPEWITLAILKQALSQQRTKNVCKFYLWEIRTFAWQSLFALTAELQPVADEAGRAQIVARFSQLPKFADQHIANLREGLRLGYSAPRTAVTTVIGQLDSLLAEPLADSPFFSPAKRAAEPDFVVAWTAIVNSKIRPALAHYRDFLRDEYLPKARTTASIRANKGGAECYRAILKAETSIDIDATELYNRGVARVAQETTIALAAGQRLYGRKFADLSALAQTLSADPENRFSSADSVRTFIIATVARARARAGEVVSNPPSADVDLIPFSDAASATAPSGQYVPGDDQGTRKAVYYYRADYQNLAPSQLEATVLHETWPGHHLQQLVTRDRVRTGAHRIARLVYFPGMIEGWATYTEGLARELPLYNSELGTIGSVMDSSTPDLVADIGMHGLGWSEQQIFDYLQAHHPAMPKERIQSKAAGIVEEPGLAVPYAMGGMEIEAIRDSAKRLAGAKFDLPTFHRLIIEDGPVPFAELRAKVTARMK
ncbi:DUF885 domain-containing protein [Steroidobacter cummioxidans]|uniref:DUF885 domain-containing protein n=1 Tax=Steroidobacter cummioxidans TaxID=1803913 RepID=UPI000E3139F0|nr:DUF885 domain-containing protein [Steroidobacter cummioxidans]